MMFVELRVRAGPLRLCRLSWLLSLLHPSFGMSYVFLSLSLWSLLLARLALVCVAPIISPRRPAMDAKIAAALIGAAAALWHKWLVIRPTMASTERLAAARRV
jgi:hypothetical protein